jgi:protein TonB
MAYADQQMSGNRLTALIVVAVLHIVLGYALVTGLAYEGVKQVLKKVTTIDIKEEEKKPPPPPPKPKDLPPPPPIVAPPPKVNLAPPPTYQTVATPPPAPPPVAYIPPPAPVPAPPPPPAPRQATPKNNQSTWVTDADYPSSAMREQRQGVTAVRLTVGPDGRVANCDITRSSGSPDLDNAACSNITRRARFNPAMENGQPTTGTFSRSVRWVVPKD